MNADPDPDPATQINADPCGSGSETLKKRNDADLSLGVPGLPGEDNVSLEDGRGVEQVPDHCLNFVQIFKT